MPAIQAAGSKRPSPGRPPLRWLIGRLLRLLLLVGLLGAGFFWDAPVLATDWMVRDRAVPIRGAEVEGSCREHAPLSTCNVTLTAPGANGTTVTRSVEYAFTSFHSGSRTAQVVGDPQRPQWLTTDLGLDHFWNRVLTLVISAGLLAAVIVNQTRHLVSGLRRR